MSLVVDLFAGAGGWSVALQAHAGRPAPVVDTKALRSWHLQPGSWADGRDGGHRTPRPADRPSPTVALGHDMTGWCWTRPATTVQATPRIARPGHHERQWADSIPVTMTQLAVLQGFPPHYPWTGNRHQQSAQVGNAIPPQLAVALIRAARTTAGATTVEAVS